MTIDTPAAAMSDAQHAALTAARAAADGIVIRGGRFSSSVLISLCTRRRGWATQVYTTVQAGNVKIRTLSGARITDLGRRELLLVDRDRAQAARDAAVRKLGVITRADPFAAFRALAEHDIPF